MTALLKIALRLYGIDLLITALLLFPKSVTNVMQSLHATGEFWPYVLLTSLFFASACLRHRTLVKEGWHVEEVNFRFVAGNALILATTLAFILKQWNSQEGLPFTSVGVDTLAVGVLFLWAIGNFLARVLYSIGRLLRRFALNREH